MTSPSRIIPSPVMSESFSGVNPGTKGRENTRSEECAGKTIKQPHDDEWPLTHGGDGAAKEAISSHKWDVRKAEGGIHEAIIFVFVQCGFFGRRAKQPKEHGSEYAK